MDEEMMEAFFEANRKCYDRFSFDRIFRFLVSHGYDREEAKDMILYNCALSTLVMQERIDNEYYLELPLDEMSKDLTELYDEEYRKMFFKDN